MNGPMKTASFRVDVKDSAKYLQAGELNVLDTSSLVRYMEIVAHQLAKEELPSKKTTVGVECKIRHLAPTAMGKEIVIKVKLMKKETEKLFFEIVAYEGEKLIGESKHTRMIVEKEAFLKTV